MQRGANRVSHKGPNAIAGDCTNESLGLPPIGGVAWTFGAVAGPAPADNVCAAPPPWTFGASPVPVSELVGEYTRSHIASQNAQLDAARAEIARLKRELEVERLARAAEERAADTAWAIGIERRVSALEAKQAGRKAAE